MTEDEQALRRALERMLNAVSHWGPPRWKGRAESVHALVQRIADRAVEAEGQPRRLVPRLDSDLALPDQLRVVVADLLAAGASPPALRDSAEDLDGVRAQLRRG